MNTKKLIFIVGPTASGKTGVGVALAKKIDAEIISADSMQIYKKMDIGTAKPTKREMSGIKHHLIDFVSPAKEFSVFDYYARAIPLIKKIVAKGKTPIIVGGTGLYVRALLQGIDEAPPANLGLRLRLERRAAAVGVEVLHKELKKKSHKRASEIESTDLKRIIRALEIADYKKRHPNKKFKKGISLKKVGFDSVVVGLMRDREHLYLDIDKRVDQMFRKGLRSEVEGLMKLRLSKTARQAVGYKEILDALEGKYSMEEARVLVKRNSRRLAKRQMTWFRGEKNLQWIDLDRLKTKKNVVDFILAKTIRP